MNKRALSLEAVCIVAMLGAAATSLRASDEVVLTEPAGELTLKEALALAIMQSPELATFAVQERASEARLVQAGRLRNPELGVQVEDVLGTGDFSGGQQSQTTLQLSQVIELGGKRGARKSVASQLQSVVRAEYELKRVEVLAEVTRRFIQVVVSQHELELATTSRALAAEALSTVRERAKAGKGSALDERKAEVTLARVDLMVEAAQHELDAARKTLVASWGGREPVFQRARGDLFALTTMPSFEDLAARISRSPEVARWVSVRKLREAEVTLANSRGSLDLELDAGYRHHESSDDEAFVFGLSIPLPIFDRNQGGRAESRALVELADAEREAAEFRLRSVLLGLYEEMAHDAHAMEGLQKEILPLAEDALAISREGYAQGRFSYLEVLDAQRTVFDVHHEYIQTAASYHQFILEIEKLIGQPIDGVQP